MDIQIKQAWLAPTLRETWQISLETHILRLQMLFME